MQDTFFKVIDPLCGKTNSSGVRLAMAFYLKLSRVLCSNKFRQSSQTRNYKYVASIPFYRTKMRCINYDDSKRVVQAIMILFYKPKRQAQMHANKSLITNGEHEGFFGTIQNAILILARIFVIGSVVTGLAIAYLITRFTHGHVFPTILRKSNYTIIVEI